MPNPPLMEIDATQFTAKRVMVTTRKFIHAPSDSPAWVVLETEDGSEVVVAMMGPDSPASRADAARMMNLWNTALASDRENGKGH
jgi:hypothetical protein